MSSELFSVKGKGAVVIGAGSGIGKAIAELFNNLGGKVMASDMKGLEELSKIMNTFRADITNVNEVRDLVKFSLEKLGEINALYVTPSINVRKRIENYTYEEFDKVVNLNLKGTFIVLKEFLPVMKKIGGSVVLFSSIRGKVTEPGQSAYAATKAAIEQLAKTAAAEYGKYGIRVNVIAPGIVDTPFTQQIKNDPEWYRAYTEKTILKRWATPMEIASVAVFLAMPASSYITGTVIYVDGGWTAIDGRYEPNV
ncbi:SDR family NAD(P)-dependent oxidoreductase [Saccharolobus islandicus]|uniref:Short-chain dehydrogenase/reductase SDR n=2 Tax=Saccharolobus islandicus TaxID=43080 RepID=C3MV51_SACI4|nr:SDR family oxidoreductase [Sulfolobus islandicus]ACP37414.1 short-chain dehydrogenase/reductase SDR [Sulfolobus islandicus M.14.25]ACP54567.1 short-chain dehydrogenase/reductase SDR [Sulfolobus islandicus M.16.27]